MERIKTKESLSGVQWEQAGGVGGKYLERWIGRDIAMGVKWVALMR